MLGILEEGKNESQGECVGFQGAYDHILDFLMQYGGLWLDTCGIVFRLGLVLLHYLADWGKGEEERHRAMSAVLPRFTGIKGAWIGAEMRSSIELPCRRY